MCNELAKGPGRLAPKWALPPIPGHVRNLGAWSATGLGASVSSQEIDGEALSDFSFWKGGSRQKKPGILGYPEPDSLYCGSQQGFLSEEQTVLHKSCVLSTD